MGFSSSCRSLITRWLIAVKKSPQVSFIFVVGWGSGGKLWKKSSWSFISTSFKEHSTNLSFNHLGFHGQCSCSHIPICKTQHLQSWPSCQIQIQIWQGGQLCPSKTSKATTSLNSRICLRSYSTTKHCQQWRNNEEKKVNFSKLNDPWTWFVYRHFLPWTAAFVGSRQLAKSFSNGNSWTSFSRRSSIHNGVQIGHQDRLSPKLPPLIHLHEATKLTSHS